MQIVFTKMSREKKTMLKSPRDILQHQSREEYANAIFHRLFTDQSNSTSQFPLSFHNKEDAQLCYQHVLSRIQLSLDGIKTAYILPPLFLRSQTETIISLSNELYLFLCASGPVIPVVVKDGSELKAMIVACYRAISPTAYLTSNNCQSLLFG